MLKRMIMRRPVLASLVAATLLLAGVAIASPKTTLRSSWEHIRYLILPALPAASAATTIVDAGSVNTTVGASITVASGTVASPGRNLIATFEDSQETDGGVADGGAENAVSVTVTGYDQFRTTVSETFTGAGDSTDTGDKIFSEVTSVKLASKSGVVAGDTVSIGWGNKVGIPMQFSSNLREIKQAEKISANQTTRTAITVNSTNFDTTYYALKAAAFGGTVTAGDTIKLFVETDNDSPDNRFAPSR